MVSPYFHFIGVHLFFLSIPYHIGVIGAEIHKLGDVAAGLAHGNALEPFTDLIEQHNGDGFPVIAQYKGADGGDRHEEFLVHQVTVQDLADSTPQDIPADNEIRHTVGQSCQMPSSGRTNHTSASSTAAAIMRARCFFCFLVISVIPFPR